MPCRAIEDSVREHQHVHGEHHPVEAAPCPKGSVPSGRTRERPGPGGEATTGSRPTIHREAAPLRQGRKEAATARKERRGKARTTHRSEAGAWALRRIDYGTTSGGDTTMRHAALPLNQRSERLPERGPIPEATRTRPAVTMPCATSATRPSPPAAPARRNGKNPSPAVPSAGRVPSAASAMAIHPNAAVAVADRSDRHRQPVLPAVSRARPGSRNPRTGSRRSRCFRRRCCGWTFATG